jgi:predicted transcriptional regulator
VEGVMVGGGPLFRINVSEQKALDERLFLFMIMEVFLKQNSISVDQIQTEIADKLLCSREGTEEKLKLLVENGYLVYNQDAGRKEIQLKGSLSRFHLLEGYYGQV